MPQVRAFGPERRRRRAASVTPGQSVYEWITLALALAGAILGPWLFGGVRLWSVGSLVVLACVSAVMTGLRPLLFGVRRHPIYPAGLVVLVAFVLLAAVRIPGSAVPYDATLEVLRIAGLLLAFWVVADLAGGHHDRWRWIVSLLLLSASIMCLYALAQHYRGSRMVLNLVRPEVYEMRASGAFMCPNHFASFIGILLPLAAALVFCRDAGHLVRIFGAYALLVIPPALFLTQSRSGWLGAMLGLIVMALVLSLRRGWKAFLITALLAPALAGLLAVAAWSLSPMVRARVEDALRGNPRVQLWTDTMAMIREAPLLGHGPGSFRWVYPRHWHALREFTDPEHAHSEPLEAVAEHGGAGASLLLCGLLTVLGSLVLRVRKVSRARDAAFAAGVAGAATAATVHGCFDYNFHVWGVVSTLSALAAVGTSLFFASESIQPKYWLSDARRRMLAFVPVAVSLVCAFLMARATLSNLFVRNADAARLAMRNDDAEDLYDRAAAIDPSNYQAWMGYGHSMRLRMTWNLDQAARQEQFVRAEELYRKALALNPLLLDAEVSLALLHQANGDAEKALSILQSVVAKAPLHRDNLCRLGIQLRRMGRDKEALAVFERAEAMGSNETIQLNLNALRAAGS